LLRNLENDCKVLGIDATKLVTVTIDKASVTKADEAAAKQLEQEEEKINAVNTELKALKDTVDALTEQLDAPNSAYQKYTEALRQWMERRAELVGETTTRDSLSHVEAQIKELDDVPNLLKEAQTSRTNKVKEIFAQIESVVAIYRELVSPCSGVHSVPSGSKEAVSDGVRRQHYSFAVGGDHSGEGESGAQGHVLRRRRRQARAQGTARTGRLADCRRCHAILFGPDGALRE
jgi:vacuolar-type H+-ATPase subunit I/STV1